MCFTTRLPFGPSASLLKALGKFFQCTPNELKLYAAPVLRRPLCLLDTEIFANVVDFSQTSKCNLRFGCFSQIDKFWRKFVPFMIIAIFLFNRKDLSLANFPLIFLHNNLLAKRSDNKVYFEMYHSYFIDFITDTL